MNSPKLSFNGILSGLDDLQSVGLELVQLIQQLTRFSFHESRDRRGTLAYRFLASRALLQQTASVRLQVAEFALVGLHAMVELEVSLLELPAESLVKKLQLRALVCFVTERGAEKADGETAVVAIDLQQLVRMHLYQVKRGLA